MSEETGILALILEVKVSLSLCEEILGWSTYTNGLTSTPSHALGLTLSFAHYHSFLSQWTLVDSYPTTQAHLLEQTASVSFNLKFCSAEMHASLFPAPLSVPDTDEICNNPIFHLGFFLWVVVGDTWQNAIYLFRYVLYLQLGKQWLRFCHGLTFFFLWIQNIRAFYTHATEKNASRWSRLVCYIIKLNDTLITVCCCWDLLPR